MFVFTDLRRKLVDTFGIYFARFLPGKVGRKAMQVCCRVSLSIELVSAVWRTNTGILVSHLSWEYYSRVRWRVLGYCRVPGVILFMNHLIFRPGKSFYRYPSLCDGSLGVFSPAPIEYLPGGARRFSREVNRGSCCLMRPPTYFLIFLLPLVYWYEPHN